MLVLILLVASWARFSLAELVQTLNTSVYPQFPLLSLGKFPLEIRQEEECSAGPGGPICDAVSCCAAGQHCCDGGCCENSDNCFGFIQCCPKDAQTCGGSTCCIPGSVCCPSIGSGCCPQGTSCCGDQCCEEGEICERNTCIDIKLKNSIARFHYDEKKNGALLRNMCNGMKGENTMTLTYSGPMSESEKRAKRGSAGCVSGYCAKLAMPALNSCDEFPPASSEEGGDTFGLIDRAINCIPGPQNSHQGGILGNVQKKLKSGDEFVISIDCDEVLGGIHSRSAIQLSGSSNSNNTFPPSDSLDGPHTYTIAAFGDLTAGTYNVTMTCVSGSTLGAFVLDNLGTNLTGNDTPITKGQSQQFSFNIATGGELMGVGLFVSIASNSTNITWSITGQDPPPPSVSTISPTVTTSSRPLPAISGNSAKADSNVINFVAVVGGYTFVNLIL